jgi:hypothetical protein
VCGACRSYSRTVVEIVAVRSSEMSIMPKEHVYLIYIR